MNGTVDVPNYVDGNIVLYSDIHKAFTLYEMIVCSEYDFPCVPPRERFSVFKPLDHRSNEFYTDIIFAIVRPLELWAFVGFLHFAGAFRLFGFDLEPK